MLTSSEGAIWKQVVEIYQQWDPSWQKPMPIEDVASRLPAIDSAMIRDTLVHAAADHLAEVDVSDPFTFKPIQDRVTGGTQ